MEKHLVEHHQKDEKELILKPWNFAYVLDKNTGKIKTFTGPTTYTMTPNDVPVVFANNQFIECRLEQAITKIPVAVEGFYMVVLNPSVDGNQPEMGSQITQQKELTVGRRINMPGPVTFPTWPGQMTEVIKGHRLRSNEYLLIKVYNDEEARKNWGAAVIKSAEGEDGITPEDVSIDLPPDLAVGKHYNIEGTKVSFYMPPTGVSVVPLHQERTSNDPDKYVRQALTLERLEYCILIDENGNKRYERGPKVVFPKPTETFVEKSGRIKFNAIELNPIQGIHIKVIAPYKEGEKQYEEGDELFITGKQTAIYFPREEHSSVTYDGKSKHFATAIPGGEARYVMNRLTGEIKKVEGEAMLLPDPRTEVIVRRVLSERQCKLWYPGNLAALEYNDHLRNIVKSVPTTRAGTISDGDYERSTKKEDRRKSKSKMDVSHVSGDQHLVGDEFTRASTYTQPRTVTLDTKFEGAPRLDVWTNYAVLIVSPSGKRRVVVGPQTVLLDYEETLEVLTLSTGKPKNTDDPKETVYLRVKHNTVADIIEDIETSDHVRVDVKLVHKVDFEGEPERWFDIENYVKHLCDHVRSVIKGVIKQVTIKDFYKNPTAYIRDTILGTKQEGDADRPGMAFENGMRIWDVDVLRVDIKDQKIQELLNKAQHDVVTANIMLSNAQHDLDTTTELERIKKLKEAVQKETQIKMLELRSMLEAKQHVNQMEQMQRNDEQVEFNAQQKLKAVENKLQLTSKEIQNNIAVHEVELGQKKDFMGVDISWLEANTQAIKDRAGAVTPQLATAIEQFNEVIKLKSLVDNFGELGAITGQGIAEKTKQILDLLPKNLRVHLDAPSNGDGKRLSG